jgi:hypothetical protein
MENMKCPKCGNGCHRDTVDIGVGVIHGPWGCPNCAWSSDPEYDFSSGKSKYKNGGKLDQFGGFTPHIDDEEFQNECESEWNKIRQL